MTSVPDHWSFIAASRRAVPSKVVTWVSWPQACITGVSVPSGKLAGRLGRKGQAGLLLDRKRVHVGAEHQHWAGPVLHHRDDAGLADMFGHLEAELAHFGGELGRRAHLLHRQLGIGMEVAVKRHQLGMSARIASDKRGRGGGAGIRSWQQPRAIAVFISVAPCGTSSITSSRDSKCGWGINHPPAIGADPLDIAGDVALVVLAILHSPAFRRRARAYRGTPAESRRRGRSGRQGAAIRSA